MGDGAYISTASATRSLLRESTGTSAFFHDTEVRAGRAATLHESLDLTRKPIRESLDVAGKAPATPILVFLDVTGSMSRFPHSVIRELHKLGAMVAERGVVTDPQFCFAAIGDADSDRAPIQVGEFEADDERAEACLANIFLEGNGGGGQPRESYELALYFAANQTRTSAETRGEKGFMFIIGDEGFYPQVSAHQVNKYLGGGIQEDIPTESVAHDAQEKWHIFLIRPRNVGHWQNQQIEDDWKSILEPQHVMYAGLDDILAQIAGTISVISGQTMEETARTMRESGFSEAEISSARANLGALATAGA